jgi:peptidoglycan/xylan/chitin deacetylase (PgdA/CDA1 family)
MKHPRMRGAITRFTAACDALHHWQPHLLVLYYHTLPESMLDAFRAQLDLLLKLAQPVPALADAARLPHRPCVAVTIDDGFVSTIRRALPNLMERGIPVTLFVPAGLLGCRPSWSPGGEFDAHDETIVSSDELRVLAREPLVTIASHGMNHADFARLEEREARYQMAASKALLEYAAEREVGGFSFPYGHLRPGQARWAYEAGYSHVFGTAPLPATTSHGGLIGRVRVDPWDEPHDFERKLRGAYRWLGYASNVKQGVRRMLKAA